MGTYPGSECERRKFLKPLNVGIPAKLKVTVTPSTARPKLVYSSSNEAAATIDQSGNITVVAAGTSVLTVATEDGKFSDTTTITCRDTWTLTVAASNAAVNGSGEYRLGDTVTINAGDPETDKEFIGWESGSGITFADSTSATTTFTMIGEDVTVTAKWADYHTVTMNGNCNTVDGGTKFIAGTTVGITCNDNDLIEWSCSDPTVTFADKTNHTTTFVMPDQDITIDHTFKTYTVTVEPNRADVIKSSGHGSYAPDTEVTLRVLVPEYCKFDKYECENSSVTLSEVTNTTVTHEGKSYQQITSTFTMPEADITITADCTVLFAVTEGGEVSASAEYKALGAAAPSSLAIPAVVNNVPITKIAKSGFQYCEALTSITIPNSVTEVGDQAFRRSGLTSIDIPGSVLTIGETAFEECKSLKTAVLHEGTTSIKRQAFNLCSSLESINIPASVTNCSTNMFIDCTSLKSVTLNEGLKEIGTSAFSRCTSLTGISLPSTLTTIQSNAFYGTGLTSVNIPESVTTIGGGAFGNCTSLTTITIDKQSNSITGSPWGASSTIITWASYSVRHTNTAGTLSIYQRKPGEKVTFSVAAKTGHNIKLTGDIPLSDMTINGDIWEFTMPAKDVSFTVTYEAVKVPFTIDGGGTIVGGGATGEVDYGAPINITAPATSGTAKNTPFYGWELVSGSGTFGDPKSRETTFTVQV